MITDRVTVSHRSKWSSEPAPVGVVVEVWFFTCTIYAAWDGEVWRHARTGAVLPDVAHWAAKVDR